MSSCPSIPSFYHVVMHHECALLVDVRLPLQTTQYTQVGGLDFVLAEPIRVFIFLFNHVLSMYPTILLKQTSDLKLPTSKFQHFSLLADFYLFSHQICLGILWESHS